METRGTKIKRNSVSEQPRALAYEVKKQGRTAKEVSVAKTPQPRINLVRLGINLTLRNIRKFSKTTAPKGALLSPVHENSNLQY